MPEETEGFVKELIRAIGNLHGCESTWVESVPVKETFQGQTVWEGTVQVFDLIGHPTAKRCYAWSHATKGKKRRFVAVLHQGPVNSPEKAVRAAIASESREQGGISVEWSILIPNLDSLVAHLAGIRVNENKRRVANAVAGHLVTAVIARNKRQVHPRTLKKLVDDSTARLWNAYKRKRANPDTSPQDAADEAVFEELDNLMGILRAE